MSAVSVRLDGALYGIDVDRVERVLRPPPVSRVPHPPRDVQGVAQVGGAVLAVVDLGTRLRGRPAALPGRLVVVRGAGAAEPVALRVDAVAGLVDGAALPEAPPDEAQAALPEGWITAVVEQGGGRRVALLDLDRVLGEGEA